MGQVGLFELNAVTLTGDSLLEECEGESANRHESGNSTVRF